MLPSKEELRLVALEADNNIRASFSLDNIRFDKDNIMIDDVPIFPQSLKSILNMISIDPDRINTENIRMENPFILHAVYREQPTVNDFIRKFMKQIRSIICGQEGNSIAQAAGLPAQGAATALATWMATAFGIANPIAIGFAVVILLVLAKATKGAFCDLSDEAALKQI